MDFISNTQSEIKEMLEIIGVKSVEELFGAIPAKIRASRPKLPEGLTEPEVVAHLEKLSLKNASLSKYLSFLGGGAYEHYIPSVVDAVISRSEFYTAYTPYQPEASQGYLQAIFEYQSMICELTGMDVSNASVYDGATAAAEAAILSMNHTSLNKIVVSEALNPQYKQVLKTFLQGRPSEIIGVPVKADGTTDFVEMQKYADGSAACIIIQNPNFFGVIEPAGKLLEIKKQSAKALTVAVVNPVSLGIIKPPSEYGADIVVGDAQVFGNPLSYGGPYLGFMAVKEALAWKMPGRITGMTKDKNGKDCFVLTLQSREQHIKREKASSNICSNQALNALAACVYMSALGKYGLKELGVKNISACAYLMDEITKIRGYSLPHARSAHFNEFVLKSDLPVDKVLKHMVENNIFAGIKLERFYPGFEDTILVTVTETKSKQDMDKFAGCLRDVSQIGG